LGHLVSNAFHDGARRRSGGMQNLFARLWKVLFGR
jgi:hypothetical protein